MAPNCLPYLGRVAFVTARETLPMTLQAARYSRRITLGTLSETPVVLYVITSCVTYTITVDYTAELFITREREWQNRSLKKMAI